MIKSNFFKFLLLMSCLLPVVFLIAKKNFKKVELFEASGEVVDIEWNSWDHGMPVISIKNGDQVWQFKSNRIILNSEDIRVGDSFKKMADSKNCIINNVSIVCIN